MRWFLLCLLLSGCSNTSYLVPDHEKSTSEYNLMDSPDGMQDPNIRVKLIRTEY